MSRNTTTLRARHMPRVIAGIGAALALGVGLAITPGVAPQSSPVLAPVQAQAYNFAGLDVINGNNNGRELHVCKDWGWASGTWYAKTCKSDGTNGSVQRLQPGQRSTQGDTDSIHVPNGYMLERLRPRRDGSYWAVERGCVSNGKGWTKVQPLYPAGSIDKFRIRKC